MFKEKLTIQPPYYWEEKSYVMAVPQNEEEDLLKYAMKSLEKSSEFKILDEKIETANNSINVTLEYGDLKIDVGFFVGGLTVPPYYVQNLPVSEETKQKILNAKKAITIFMSFKDNPKKYFHIQLKLALLLVRDLLVLLDESAERLFTKEWVEMTAKSKEAPSARDLFSVQAISGNKKEVWLHTHGLARCGKTELEILDSTQETSQNHYNLINSYAMYLIDKKDDSTSDYIGRLINGAPIVATYLSWPDALKHYKHIKLGGKEDRKTGHNSTTSVIFLYTSEEDEKNNIVSKISIYDKLWEDNPIFFFSNEETARMKNVAIERFNYVKKAHENKENSILLKIGLPLEDGGYEHIWFELLEFKEEKFQARLTQEPYYFPEIHEGYVAWYEKKDITDWIIYTKTRTITPDNVYLLNNPKD